jgi:hypothetical protein
MKDTWAVAETLPMFPVSSATAFFASFKEQVRWSLGDYSAEIVAKNFINLTVVSSTDV